MTNLKKFREETGISQAKLSEISGVSVRMIQHYEQGVKDINKASGSTLYRLAIALDIPIESILEVSEILSQEERERKAE